MYAEWHRALRPLAPRACQCGFCRRHGARTVSDPAGAASLSLGEKAMRYRFGTGTTDFLICGRCGVYVAALAQMKQQRQWRLKVTHVSERPTEWDEPQVKIVAH